jgi:hypothetical protein
VYSCILKFLLCLGFDMKYISILMIMIIIRIASRCYISLLEHYFVESEIGVEKALIPTRKVSS